MRTTVDLDDALVKQAIQYSGIKKKTELLEEALRQLVRHEAGQRLIALGGSAPSAKAPSRRRFR